jgi:hypothetical protein
MDSGVDAAECPDVDLDGHGAAPCGDDCDDTDSTRYPGAIETCDGDDEDCDDTTLGSDGDGDDFVDAACCNGVGNCGTDCNDTDSNVHPGATEVCDGFDNDCDVSVDEGVCAPCATGYTGFDGTCTDVDECAILGACGTGSTGCTNTPGSFACTCTAGYQTASATGALCENVDECASSTNPCGTGTCTDNAGSYVCTCPAGYRLASAPAITCVDADECAEGTDACTDVPPALCANTLGSYTCACPAGYEGAARGSGGCLDIDECARATDDCTDVVGVCANTVGGFTCGCVGGFLGTGVGPGACQWNDPSLTGLAVGAGGTLGPAFAAVTTTYTLTLAPGATSASLTPSVAWPTRATVVIAGATIAPGASAVVSVTGSAFAFQVVDVQVTTESGATRTYTLLVSRGPTYVKASNTAPNELFGYAVARSADGTRLAVGARYEDSNATGIGGNQSDNSAIDSGAVYVFALTGTTWTQEAYIKASNTDAGDWFGKVVSLSADGSRLAVGAHQEDSSATGIGGSQADNGAADSGAVYVFSRSGTTWAQEAYVKPSNTGAGDYFGISLSLSADGTRLAVGAEREDSSAIVVGGNGNDNGATNAGAAYVFALVGTTWTQEAYVKTSNTGGGDALGCSIALSPDGTRLAVGAYGEDSNATGIDGNGADNTASDAGAAYVFSRTGATWTQEAYVKASNTGATDRFGYSVSLSADGARLAVGAYWEDSSATGVGGNQADNTAVDSGAVYVFSRTATNWTEDAYVKASNTGAGDSFGIGVSLSADGSHLAVAAVYEDSSATGIGGNQADNGATDSGAVYVLAWAGAAWTQEAYVKASNTGAGDQFGISLSLSPDGGQLAVGAFLEDSAATGIGGNSADNSASSAGAVYVH